MMRMRTLKYLTACLALVPLAAAALNGCSVAADAAAGCEGLDAKANTAQASLLAFNKAAADLNVATGKMQGKFLAVCNAMNADLGLDTTKTTAQAACAVLNDKVKAVVAAGGTVTVTVTPHCDIDFNAQATCQATCTPAACDIRAHCTGGEVVATCNGTCSGSCDIKNPTVACMGTCQGTCDAAVQCSGICEGQCTAPTFEGTCDAGCTAMFEGKCEGTCNGTCDAVNTNGACAGTCKGVCTGKATGKCQAQCTGHFSGGKCTGSCTGSCTVAAACSGKCDGTCTYTPGSATCQGECHGMCSAEVTPPTCTGHIDCTPPACQSSCEASARANVDCSQPEVVVTITGNSDDAVLLNAVIHKHLQEWGEAVSQVKTLEAPLAVLGNTSKDALSAIGDVGVGGLTCAASAVSVMGQASVSFSVSVQASASFDASSR